MCKKPAAPAPGTAPAPEWDPCMKEPWHEDFEKEPVNDGKWSCIVTAAIPVEAGDDECIQSYTQCVNTGLRKAVKIISMADVVELLKESVSVTDNQKVKPDKAKTEKADKMDNHLERGDFKPLTPRPNQIVGLAAKYATFMDHECKLPPDLMAGVLKYLILNLKEENCFQKRVQAVKARKMKEKVLKAKFIRSLKPYEINRDEKQFFGKVPSNILELEEPIDDQPLNGPDLFILLTDIHDLFCFPELVRLKVPFSAILRVASAQDKGLRRSSLTFIPSRIDTNSRKTALLFEFWERLKENCMTSERTAKFKDIAMLSYEAPLFKNMQSKRYYLLKVFNELTWMQYSVYNIHRQHQIYLRQLHVQRLIMPLQPLDLDKCEVYSKICDILITGQLLTPALVLHAIIEQVVAGVPETESVVLEYKPQFDVSDTFIASTPKLTSAAWENPKHFDKKLEFTTPCTECRNKIGENICEKLKNAFTLPVKNNRVSTSGGISESPHKNEGCLPETSLLAKESQICEMLNEILAEKQAEKDTRKGQKWKAPHLCFHGDNVFFQMYHCDPRLLTAEALVNRFLRPIEVSKVWTKYPELPPENRAFFNFHFACLKNISQESEESLRLKIHFMIVMRLLGTVKSYLYRGLEKSISEAVFFTGNEKMMKASKVKFDQNLWNTKAEEKDFSDCLFKAVATDKGSRLPRKHIVKSDTNRSKTSLTRLVESENPGKTLTNFSMTFLSHRSTGTWMFYKQNDGMNPFCSLTDLSNHSKVFLSLLDASEISSLNEPYFLSNKNEYLQLTQSFKFYEKLDSPVMIQRLLEAGENYNTTQYSYFAPTDAVMVVMINDFDYRGVFYTYGTGVIPTPVSLRDFHGYVYNGILNWLVELEETYTEFLSSLEEKAEAAEEKRDEEYLTQLKREYCEMSPEKKKEFLETVMDLQSEPSITEEELGDLPDKPKFVPQNKISFVVTNLADVRVECKRKVNEFHSRDGLEVNVLMDKWLYEPLSLLTLIIKRPKLRLYYHQWMGDENLNTAFTFKTTSDIIFAFYKDSAEETEDFNYNVNISWPTGLMVQPIFSDSGLYIKQGYLAVYRSGWDIKEEKSRCYLKNGQVLVFKENRDMDILCGNGTKYIFCESAAVPRYEIISTTGEVWEVRTKGPCRFRKKLRTTLKIFIGTDPKTQETYYRREDGVNCMLWPNGRLVTTYSDGTKITSTPYFDEEVEVEWSEEEKLYFSKVESKQKMEISELRSRTILRNFSGPRISESSTFTVEAFVSISCSYLMEHPKYSTVFFNPEEPFVTLTMPQNLTLHVYPEGNYELRQEKDVLTVQGSTVEFCLTCEGCDNRSGATVNLNEDEILCKVIDFFQKGFLVNRKGKVIYQDSFQECQESSECDITTTPNGQTNQGQCINQHTKSSANNQRCFVLNRDLSGVEFIHEGALACDCYELPHDTYFDLHTEDPPKVSHTFSSSYCRIDYENWVMDYEDKDNSLPTNLKKKDLKELGVKENPDNFFKYPFPKHHNRSEIQLPVRPQKQVDMPKVTVARIIKCLSEEPNSLIENMHSNIGLYQKRARDISVAFTSHKVQDDLSRDQRVIKMRLKKIALTLNQSLKMYPHLCTQSPSTEKDIHYFGHFIQLMEEFKSDTKEEQDPGIACKQIPKPLPRSSAFPAIHEESNTL